MTFNIDKHRFKKQKPLYCLGDYESIDLGQGSTEVKTIAEIHPVPNNAKEEIPLATALPMTPTTVFVGPKTNGNF